MLYVKLVVAGPHGGDHDVAIIAIPPFRILPDVLLWGDRYFVNTKAIVDARPVYRECLCFAVPTT